MILIIFFTFIPFASENSTKEIFISRKRKRHKPKRERRDLIGHFDPSFRYPPIADVVIDGVAIIQRCVATTWGMCSARSVFLASKASKSESRARQERSWTSFVLRSTFVAMQMLRAVDWRTPISRIFRIPEAARKLIRTSRTALPSWCG